MAPVVVQDQMQAPIAPVAAPQLPDRQLLLSPLAHLGEAHPGVELQLRLVLEEETLALGELPEELEDRLQSLPLLLWIGRRRDRPDSTPAESQPVEGASDRLTADEHPSLPDRKRCKASSRQLQRERSQP